MVNVPLWEAVAEGSTTLVLDAVEADEDLAIGDEVVSLGEMDSTGFPLWMDTPAGRVRRISIGLVDGHPTATYGPDDSEPEPEDDLGLGENEPSREETDDAPEDERS